MHPANRGPVFFQRAERRGVQRPAGVQDHFAAQLFGPDAGQFARNILDRVVRDGYQYYSRGQDFSNGNRMGLTSTDEADCFSRGHNTASYDRADFPSQFAQSASQRTSDAACPDDRQAFLHAMLG